MAVAAGSVTEDDPPGCCVHTMSAPSVPAHAGRARPDWCGEISSSRAAGEQKVDITRPVPMSSITSRAGDFAISLSPRSPYRAAATRVWRGIERARRVAPVAAVIAGMLLPGVPSVAAAAAAVHDGFRRVTYLGHSFDIPRGWRVISLARHR